MPSLSNTNLQRSRRWRLSGIDTIINFEAVEKYGVKAEGNTAGASAEVLAELAQCIERRELEIPIARVYSLPTYERRIASWSIVMLLVKLCSSPEWMPPEGVFIDECGSNIALTRLLEAERRKGRMVCSFALLHENKQFLSFSYSRTERPIFGGWC